MAGGELTFRLSAVVACYRDAQAIPFMYSRLVQVCARLGAEHEIIFVNDHSPDDAADVLRELASNDCRVIVINHTRNFGSQSAFTSGMLVASGDVVVLLDGDLQDPPELIEQFVDHWRAGYLIVYGIRTKRQATYLLQLSSKLFYRLFRSAAYVSIPLDAGDFSLMDRRVVDVLNALPENNRFLRGLRAWVGFKQIGVDYTRPERMFGHTTNSLLNNLGWARKAIVSFSFAPLDFITILAAVTVLLSFVAVIGQLAFRLVAPSLVPPGFTTLIVLILFLGGIQLLCLGIVGTYLAHIYEEVKRRPPYLVESMINEPAERRAPLRQR